MKIKDGTTEKVYRRGRTTPLLGLTDIPLAFPYTKTFATTRFTVPIITDTELDFSLATYTMFVLLLTAILIGLAPTLMIVQTDFSDHLILL